MFVGSCLQAVYFLLLDHAFQSCSVYPSFLLSTMAMIACGFGSMLLRRRRTVFFANWPRIWSSARFLLMIEVANLAAVATSHYAIKYGPISLVSAVEAMIPAYTFVFSIVLYSVFKKFGEADASKRFPAKLAPIGIMVVGVWLVS